MRQLVAQGAAGIDPVVVLRGEVRADLPAQEEQVAQFQILRIVDQVALAALCLLYTSDAADECCWV